MPFYEYECPHCRHHLEVLQKISDKPLTKCPNCGKKGLRKLMSAPLFRLKGSGWYETDFKSDKENKRNLHGADKEEASAKKDDAKPDTKSDTKGQSEKIDAGKADVAKPEAAKPAAEKTAAQPAKDTAARTKPKQKSARTARRLPRR